MQKKVKKEKFDKKKNDSLARLSKKEIKERREFLDCISFKG